MDVRANRRRSDVPDLDDGSSRYKWWVGGYIFLALGCLAVYFILRLQLLEWLGSNLVIARKIFSVGFFVFLVLALSNWIQRYIVLHAVSKVARYNIILLIKFFTLVLSFFIGVSIFFENWYTAAVSLGLISLIIGFALQTPITSLIAWFYIIIRAPYHVGDRIQVDTFTGDVVEISYMDTTLWEFGGEYLTNDLPSGRLIRFPNSLVLNTPVYNYSWKKFPYIWNEIPFHIAYESDLIYVESTIREITKQELGPEMASRVNTLKQLMKETPLDETEIKEYPFVCFRTSTNTWLEALVIYLVEPKMASYVRNNIIKRAVTELLRQPDRVMFPKSNAR